VEGDGRRGGAGLTDVALAAVLAVAGFALFRPDWFHIQNGLDPFFYTGLSLNLSEAIDYGADAHYFLSRWTLYMPELLAQRLLGPSVGFVATRLVLLTLAGVGLAFLRPATSRRLDLVPVAVIGLFSPLVVRAVFVDYSDAIVVPCGLVMLALAARGRVGVRTSVAIGVLGAAAVVANTFAVVMVAITVGGYLARSLRRPGRLLAQMAAVLAAGTVVVGAGLVLFRWRYGIPNVYSPAISFVRDNAGNRDPLKSRRLLWLHFRLWVFLPPLLLAAAAALRAGRVIRLGSAELVVLGVAAVQYVFQVLYQLVLDGSTLEIHYYFSYMVPAYSAALAVVLYALLQRCSKLATWAATAAVVALLAAWRHLPEVHLASWATFVAGVLAVGVIGGALARRLPVLLPLGVAAVALAAQLAPPTREPILPGELRVQAGYDTVYRGGTSIGVEWFRAIPPFLDQVRGLDPQVRKRAGWVVGRGTAQQKAAALSVQVGMPRRLLNPPAEPLDPYLPVNPLRFAPDRFVEQGLTHVIVVCLPEELPIALTRLAELGFVVGPPLLDDVDTLATPATQLYVAPMALRGAGVP